ncbi:hypothetical protein Tco_1236565, partial [Tanacetum coccineum]
KKKKSAKDKIVNEPEKQRVSPVKSGRGKGFMCFGDQVVNKPNKLKKDDVPRKTRTPTITEETIVDTYAEWGQKLKGHIVEDPTVQSFENETDDADDSDMDLSDDSPQGDDDAAGFDANELTDFVSKPVYTNAQTTSAVIYPEANPELTSYISGASEVPLAKVLIEIKKLLPTHIPKAIANYVRPLLNTSVLDVMKNNQISLFTKPSTTTDDLSEIDLKLRLLNIIHLNKSNETHTTHQQLYDTFYDSVTLDQDALNALDAEPSFYKRTYDNQDPPNNREGENMKKRRKDVGEPSSKSSRRKKSPVIHAQDDTPAIQPVDQEDEYIQTRSNSKWYTKSGSTNVVRKTTWFDLLLKLDIEQNENHILRPSTVAIAKKLKSIIKKDELAIADFKGAGLERLKQQYQNDVELEYHVDQLKAVVLSEAKCNSDENDVSKSRMFKRHMSKNTKPCPSFYNNDFDYLVILSTEEKYTTSLTST